MSTQTLFSIQQAASMVGISDGLLILWIQTKKIVPSIEMSTAKHIFSQTIPYLPKGTELWGWDRFTLTEDDIERLRKMVEQTADQKSKAETAHVKGTHYTVQELSHLWGLGVDKIRELFSDEPGVIKIQRPQKRGRRVYVTLRIPEAVAERVQRRTSNA